MIKHPSDRAERRRLKLVHEKDRVRKPSKEEVLAAVIEKELNHEFEESVPEQTSPPQL